MRVRKFGNWFKRFDKKRKILFYVGVVLAVIFLTAIAIFALKPGEDPVPKPIGNPAGKTVKKDENKRKKPNRPALKPPAQPTPADVLNLSNWKLTLPINTAREGSPDEIEQPQLTRFALEPYFYLNNAKNGVIFRAHAGGSTTENSDYPRSELREMTAGGAYEASWSNISGVHTMTIRQAITHLPAAKPHVVAGQIHDSEDDVIMIRLEGKHLFAESDGDNVGTLDKNYRLGQTFTVKLQAAGGRIKVFYNGEQKVNLNRSGNGYYFKAGCYTQSNLDRGDDSNAYGEVIIYSLNVKHT